MEVDFMPYTPEGIYCGPMLYVVHAPIPKRLQIAMHYTKQQQNLALANEAKIIQALNAAGIRKVPVLFEAGEYTKIEGALAKVKHKPRIILVSQLEGEHPKKMVQLALRERFAPTKVTFLGANRNQCVSAAAGTMKEAFPFAEVTVLEGASTFFNQYPRDKRKEKRAEYKKEFAEDGVKRARKLTPRHFV